MLFRYIALLDNFSSDVDELDLSYENRTLKIRKIPKREIAEFLLPSKVSIPFIQGQFETVITVSEDMYWMDYSYEVDSKEAMIVASNNINEEKEKIILTLRLFQEGCLRIVFDVKKGKHIATIFTSFRGLRTSERLYFLARSELTMLKEFLREFLHFVWEKRKSKTPLSIALGRFTDGYERTKLEDKIIDYVVGLEALFLQRESLGEFGYKMSHRASILLSDKREKQREIFKDMKRLYNLRSNIVHGRKYDLTAEDSWFAEDTLRDSIRKFLNTAKPNWLDLIFTKSGENI